LRLTVAREEARQQLQRRVDLGRELRDRALLDQSALETARHEYYTWSEYNASLLERLFTDPREKEFYVGTFIGGIAYDRTFGEKVGDFRKDVAGELRRLESVIERLELADDADTSLGPPARGDAGLSGSEVFLVHGRDEGTRETIARFIERLGLRVIILHEQANAGKTLIEKFETHAEVAFAVVLLTPDDVGGLRADPSRLQARARQNVVFELGFFFGRLGRDRVCAMVSGPLERPTDVDGLAYIPIDDGEWRLQLARELRAAGLPVDMNRAV
jgi:predicted nucleotide-binding protein